ncbi:MAG TPA: UDP-N-acetylmuramoyl-L-alanyl-D-glutamate--2,6-diaminopimelate ligase [Gammaproteobacteria bacterium]
MSARHGTSLHELLNGIPGVASVPDRVVQGVSLDSRFVVSGGAFLACAGISSHGLEYIDEALRHGASVVLWEPVPGVQPPNIPSNTVSVRVPDLSAHAGAIAATFYGDPSARMSVIGITGTNGKTSVSHLAAQALSAYGRRCAVAGTLGYGFIDSLEPATHTTPDAVKLQALFAQLAGSGADAIAMEVSSHALEQQRVSGVNFHTAVFTNLTRDHLDYHDGLGAYAAAKRRLFHMPGLNAAVVNIDDAVGRDIVANLPDGVRAWPFATHAESLQGIAAENILFAERMEFDAQGISLDINAAGKQVMLRAPLFGRFNALNLLAVFGILMSLGIPADDAARALGGVRPVRGRMERLGGGERPLVIVDYAHTPDALSQILAAAREHCAGKLFCVFGCGGDRDRGKRPEMGRIAESMADAVIVTDDNPRTEDGNAIVEQIVAGMTKRDAARIERDRKIAIQSAIKEAASGDVVVIAGKGHEDYQITGTRREHFSDSEVARVALEAAA